MVQDKFLDILREEKLSSVTFIMDYLQLDFDGNQFTINIWPSVFVENIEYKFGQQLYRDKLCSLITNVVSEASFRDKQLLKIQFKNGDSIRFSLDPDNPELNAPFIAEFNDVNKRWYIFD